jgi:hypothetical protein
MVVKHTRRLKNKKSVKTIKINTRGKSVKSIRRKYQRGGVDKSNNEHYNEHLYDFASPLIEPEIDKLQLAPQEKLLLQSEYDKHNDINSPLKILEYNEYNKNNADADERDKSIDKLKAETERTDFFTTTSSIGDLRKVQQEYTLKLANINIEIKREITDEEFTKFNTEIDNAINALETYNGDKIPEITEITELTKLINNIKTFRKSEFNKELLRNFILSNIKFPKEEKYSDNELQLYILTNLLIYKKPINDYIKRIVELFKTQNFNFSTFDELVNTIKKFRPQDTIDRYVTYLTYINKILNYNLFKKYMLAIS